MRMDSGLGLFSSKDLPIEEESIGKGLITQKKKKPRNYEYDIYALHVIEYKYVWFLAPFVFAF